MSGLHSPIRPPLHLDQQLRGEAQCGQVHDVSGCLGNNLAVAGVYRRQHGWLFRRKRWTYHPEGMDIRERMDSVYGLRRASRASGWLRIALGSSYLGSGKELTAG